MQPRSRGGSGSGPIVRPFSRRIRSGSSNPGEWDFAASGMASEMTADGSAQPILAMQSSVSPLHGLSPRSEEHTSELQSLMRHSYAVFCLKQNKHNKD